MISSLSLSRILRGLRLLHLVLLLANGLLELLAVELGAILKQEGVVLHDLIFVLWQGSQWTLLLCLVSIGLHRYILKLILINIGAFQRIDQFFANSNDI